MPELGILVPISLFALVGYITKVISDNRLLRKLADSPHLSEDAAARLLAKRDGSPGALTSLKWGLVVLALGLSIVFVSVIGLDFDEPIAYGFVLLSTGVGLVGYYFIARDEQESADRTRQGGIASRSSYAPSDRPDPGTAPKPSARDTAYEDAPYEDAPHEDTGSDEKGASGSEQEGDGASFDPEDAYDEAQEGSRS